MTPEAQRMAIAVACPGWSVHHGGKYCAIQDCPRGPLSCILFDPLKDLNAMHEAEKILPDYRLFVGHLVTVLKPGEYSVKATAAQRAEAFLRTLSLWRD